MRLWLGWELTWGKKTIDVAATIIPDGDDILSRMRSRLSTVISDGWDKGVIVDTLHIIDGLRRMVAAETKIDNA